MSTATVPEASARNNRSRGRRRAEAEPRWVPPLLALVAALAAYLYGWRLNQALLHPYYTAAVRSMASSWHAFLYGGLDPSGSITVDKLPGALWLQALSVRAFGLHNWAVALPQGIEGVLTVLVLYRIVKAWAGPVAGLLAALLLTLTPITAALDRGNISDSLLTLLLVLAAGAAMKAVRDGKLWHLLSCGVWVGLAFQAKMLQAWLVLPVFALVYVVCAPGGWLRRIGYACAGGAVALAVSCSWMLWVLYTPAADRPYLDGTTGNNPFALVFGYNGLSRFGGGSGAGLGSVAGTSASRPSGGASWDVLFNTTVGPQISWFLPLAVLSLAVGLAWGRRAGRTDQLRAGYLLWGGWLLLHDLAFSASSGIHGYYTVVLAPAVAALAGAGITTLWRVYGRPGERPASGRWYLLIGGLLFSAVWAVVLDSRYPHFHPWVVPVLGLLALVSASLLALRDRRGVPIGLAAGLAALLLAPAVWSLSALNPLYAGSGTAPLAGPVGANAVAAAGGSSPAAEVGFGPAAGRAGKLLTYLEAHRGGAEYLVATQAALPAEPLLRAVSAPVLVMGGFTGNTPFPTSAALAALVHGGKLRYAVLTSERANSADAAWVKTNCTRVLPAQYGQKTDRDMTLYDCSPSAAPVAAPVKSPAPGTAKKGTAKKAKRTTSGH
ncbi:glycosyltransferase family 39 protein [Streptacidiphilus sp. P02-A3a]|uniref:ArnT family glycosyltransferase n=1 Tax=Streptacidiphilus sp. P02-A3a TaxID=2704468 RepID=UPI0015FD1B1D|nr:glycosyltransferase family 39 protein [Streptacidiphilus sp. P02-A3a]QMU67808.1 mannosyl transferase [Streptacidiphilus sp. P02-A3a]